MNNPAYRYYAAAAIAAIAAIGVGYAYVVMNGDAISYVYGFGTIDFVAVEPRAIKSVCNFTPFELRAKTVSVHLMHSLDSYDSVIISQLSQTDAVLAMNDDVARLKSDGYVEIQPIHLSNRLDLSEIWEGLDLETIPAWYLKWPGMAPNYIAQCFERREKNGDVSGAVVAFDPVGQCAKILWHRQRFHDQDEELKLPVSLPLDKSNGTIQFTMPER